MIVLWTIVTEIVAILAHILAFSKSLDQKWGLSERLDDSIQGSFDLWIHAASLGEAKACAYAVNLMIKERFDLRILLTVQTKSAFELMVDTYALHPNVCVRMYPLDRPRVLGRWIRTAQIKQVWLYESELWPGLLWADRMGARLVWMSARMGSGFMGLYQKYPKIWTKVLSRIDWIAPLDPRHPAFDGARAKTDSLVWDFKNLIPLPSKSDGRGKCLLSWHASDLPFAADIMSQDAGEWYVQPRFLDQIPHFIAWAKQQQFEIVSWPLAPVSGQICLVDVYGVTDEILQRCGESWIGGGFHQGGSSHSPRESISRGLRTWVGPFLSVADPLIVEWVGLCVGQYGVTERAPAGGRTILAGIYDQQRHNLLVLLNRDFPGRQNI